MPRRSPRTRSQSARSLELAWLALCLWGGGCSSGGVADAILETHLLDVLLQTSGYLVAGGGAGFALGALGYLVVARAGGYAGEWRFAHWARRLAALAIVFATTSAGAVAGGCLGFAAGIERFLREGEQAHATLTEAGEPMADFAFYLLVVSERHAAAAEAERSARARGEVWEPVSGEELFALPSEELEAFQGGQGLASARVEGLVERLPYRAGGEAFAEAVDELMGAEGEEVGLRHLALREGLAFLIEHGLERQVQASSGKGATRILERSLDLRSAADREGDWITRSELARHFADELYAPLIVLALRKALVPYRWGSYLLLVLAPLLPIPLFWLARYLSRRRAAARLHEEDFRLHEEDSRLHEEGSPLHEEGSPLHEEGSPLHDSGGALSAREGGEAGGKVHRSPPREPPESPRGNTP